VLSLHNNIVPIYWNKTKFKKISYPRLTMIDDLHNRVVNRENLSLYGERFLFTVIIHSDLTPCDMCLFTLEWSEFATHVGQ